MELGSPTQRTVFAVLAAHGNRVVSRDDLVRAVWGVNASETAMNSVYTYIARLRKSLEPERPRSAQSEVLLSNRLGYMLRIPADQVDTERFSSALADARRLRADNASEQAVGRLRAALGLWRGTPYAGAVGAFVEAERTRLAETRMLAIEDYAETLLELNRPAPAIGELSALVQRYPLRERLRLLLMRCHVELGQHADAIANYHALRTRLAEEQGIEPGESLRELYERVLRPERPRVPRQTRRDIVGGPAEDTRRQAPAVTRAPVAAQLTRQDRWFTGRETELQQLDTLVRAGGHTGESTLLLLTGGPGVGKTALANRFARLQSERFPDGQIHLDLGAFSARGKPYSVFSALRRLTSALGETRPLADLDLETAYRSRAADRRLLIVLDNAASVEQVRPLLPGTSSSLVIVTSRWGLAGLIARDGARRFVTEGLADEDALRLFSGIVGETFVARHRAAVDEIIAACEGLTLALRIAATQINIAPFPEVALRRFRTGSLLDTLSLPGDEHSSLSAVLGWSYASLPPEAAQMYRAFGRHSARDADLERAAVLSGRTVSDARRALGVLTDAGLVREVAPDRFRMHGLLHEHARRMALVEQGRAMGRGYDDPDTGFAVRRPVTDRSPATCA
ncbi:AfsR/SARP family transcriptional regulator [Streptomyces sp. NPDC000229]|uniref:AfsR/SARP family transcriptional regulator n=1 Tax=Streptomyces sp. NPDC000229 TaxID=3154247 RepID=UPI0033190509